MISDLKCNHAQNSHIFCTCKCLRDIASSLFKIAFRVSHELCVVFSEVRQICLEHKGYLCHAQFSYSNCSFPVLFKAKGAQRDKYYQKFFPQTLLVDLSQKYLSIF